MNHQDLTSEEQEALEALAVLDDAGRARVLGALGAATDNQPTPEAEPGPQSTGPTTFVDRIWAPTVTVAGKKVPTIPSSVGAVVLLVAMVLLVRACVGAGSPAWCDDLDEAIERAWDHESGYQSGGVSAMGRLIFDHMDDEDYTDEAMAEVREALDDAWDASNRYDGREAGRAFEDSLRGAC